LPNGDFLAAGVQEAFGQQLANEGYEVVGAARLALELRDDVNAHASSLDVASPLRVGRSFEMLLYPTQFAQTSP
jgi:hypothetical protein